MAKKAFYLAEAVAAGGRALAIVNAMPARSRTPLPRAERKLHISQPPLSRHIRSLEDELGTPLFERTARGMRMLPAGEVLLRHTPAILAAVDRASAEVRELGFRASGPSSRPGPSSR